MSILSPLLLLSLTSCNKQEEKKAVTWDLEIVLGASSVTAGDAVEYEVWAVPSRGDRELLTKDFVLSSDAEPTLDWDRKSLRPIKAATQQIAAAATVSGSQVQTSTELTVRPGPPESVTLNLETRGGSFEVGDAVGAEVTIRDAYGNETRDPWTLTVEGGTAEVSGANITFLSDGLYTVTANVTDTALSDSEGPLLVDSSGPVFTMRFPQHVDMATGGFERVRGNVVDPWSGVLYATLNGDQLSLDEVGDFQSYHAWDFGLNFLTLQALDYDGNQTELIHTVLSGDLLPPEVVVSEGLLVHLGAGEGGLDEVVAGLDSEIDDIDISGTLPIEMTGSKYDLAITDVDYRFRGIEIEPIEGALLATTSLEYIEVDIEGKVKAVVWLDVTGDVDIESMDVAIDLVPVVYSGGHLTVTVGSTSVEVRGLEMNFDSSLFSIMESIGVDTILEDYITNMLEEQIAVSVQTVVRQQLQEALRSIELDQTVNVMDRSYQLSGEFSRAEVDEGGITVAMDVTVTPEEDVAELAASSGLQGSLYAGYAAPDLSRLGGIAAGINLDLLNRMVYLVWAEGVLEQTITGEELGLSADTLKFVFPDAESVTFGTEALLPPVILPGDAMIPMAAQIGALRLVAVDQDDAVLLDITVGAVFDVDMDVDATGRTLTPSLALSGNAWVEVTEVAQQSTDIVNYEALIELLLPQVMDSLATSLQAVTLPAVEGSTLTISRIQPYGEGGGYLTAVGTMDLGY